MLAPGDNPERVDRVKKARDAWVKRLIDLTRRNNLLYFRDLQVGTLDLSGAKPEILRDLLTSQSGDGADIALRRLVDAARLQQAAASLTKIAEKALANYEERGLDTLFVAIGLATWEASDGGRPASSPILLLPVKVSRSGANGEWALQRSGDVQINDVLAHALLAEHGIALDANEFLRELQREDDEEPFQIESVFNRVRQAAAPLSGFSIDHRWVVGNFSFQKLAIVRDLKDLLAAMVKHPIVAGIAGDATAREEARAGRLDEPDVHEFDAQPPGEEFLILDADSTQQRAILSTLASHNGVVSGPPGTGKSQTIANLIAEMAARGKTVLFVAEKRAALDVVLNRLRAADLGHLSLDLHGADVSLRWRSHTEVPELWSQYDESAIQEHCWRRSASARLQAELSERSAHRRLPAV